MAREGISLGGLPRSIFFGKCVEQFQEIDRDELESAFHFNVLNLDELVI